MTKQKSAAAVQSGMFAEKIEPEARLIETSRILRPNTGRLITSVGALGRVLQAVTLKPSSAPGFDFEVVYGKARVNSAYEYGIEAVPALLLETDNHVAEAGLRLAENGDRSPNYADEAGAVLTLLGGGWTISDIAWNLGMDVETVKQRGRLAELPGTLLDQIDQRAGLLGHSVAIMFATLKGSYRAQAIEHAEALLVQGQKITAKQVWKVMVRRDAATAAELDVLFAQDVQETLLDEAEPINVLLTQIGAMCAARQIDLGELHAALGRHLGQDAHAAPMPIPPARRQRLYGAR